jgi:flagellar assembly factor FliW
VHVNYTGQPEELTVAEAEVITFPHGLVGCADWRRFVLLSEEEAPGLHILQSLDEPRIHFLVTDPALVEPAYRATIDAHELDYLGLARPEDGVLLCILTARGIPPQVTANLLGPLVLNPIARLGMQIILVDSPYTTKHPLPLTHSPEGEAAEC